jgi:hypothetical protein
MQSVERLFRSRHSVGSEIVTVTEREQVRRRERLTERKGEEAVKPNAFSRKPALTPPFIR